MTKYNPAKIEKKWQKYWLGKKLFHVSNASKKDKEYVLVEFPYPSGVGLHVGHGRSYVAADVTARYFRAKGKDVILPYGWDAFGLPAENFAIKMGIHPEVTTKKNVKNIVKQVNSWGLSVDWSREVNTTDPNYYKWTQWIFLQFYKAGLAYEATAPINWCPKDKTGLANEEVIDGKCERCGTEVERKDMRQWFLKITAYAQKLLDGLKDLDWPEAVKLQQENWIGRSEGAEINFSLSAKQRNDQVTVFTTRPDTLFGATYLVLAPEHHLVNFFQEEIRNWSEVKKYVEKAKNKTDLQRGSLEREKTGVLLEGVTALNPATGQKIPVWIADYVLISYGTGAIMAVPAHDERDQEFAEKYKLPIIEVVDSNGKLKNSKEFNGLLAEKAKSEITKKYGKVKVQYKLRDWVFSRQRYWGEPIPLVHCPACGTVSVPEQDLPVTLPKVKKYEPTGTGESPLAAVESWVKVRCPNCGGKARRETNTMPQWAGSSWYFLRYADPKNKKEFASKAALERWMPIDIYFGGMEHTTLHLLYSRFWNLFLYDQGLVPVKEPYKRRQPHGIILGPDGEKMSKSRGNVINPDDIVKEFGADTFRMYELFLGPHDQTVSWNDKGTVGVFRFLQRSWNFVAKNAKTAAKKSSEKAEIEINKLIKEVEADILATKFNTAISSLMEFLNAVDDQVVSKELLKKYVIVLAPFAPHLSEELWFLLGNKTSVAKQAWPSFDLKKIEQEKIQLVVQVNGKFRGNLEVDKGIGQIEVEIMAMQIDTVRNAMNGQKPKKVIFVPNRILNFVV